LQENELSLEELSRIADELKEIKISTVSISGGEPFMRDDLLQVVEKLKANGFWINITTNGILLDRERSTRLIELGVDSIVISIDGMEKVHNEIRGLPIFQKLISNISNLLSLKEQFGREELSIGVASTLMSNNMNSVLECNALFSKLKVNHLFESLFSLGENFFSLQNGCNHVNLKPHKNEFTEFLLELKRRKTKDIQYFELMKKYNDNELRYPSIIHPCLAGLFNIVITETGNVLPCCSWYDGGVVDNIRNRSLREIWKSTEFYQKRKQIFKGHCPGCWVSTYARTSSDIWIENLLVKAQKRIFGE